MLRLPRRSDAELLWQTARMRRPLPRLFASIPDALTSVLYLVAWIVPRQLGPEHVKQLMFAMLIEFMVLHSSAAFDGSRPPPGWSQGRYLGLLIGLTALYLGLAALFAWAWDSPWPFYAFAWLFVCRFFHLLTYPAEQDEQRRTTFYGANLGTFFAAMFVLVLPLPRLGLTPEFTAAMQISGSGTLASAPQLLIAFGATYFMLQSWLKYAFVPGNDGSHAP